MAAINIEPEILSIFKDQSKKLILTITNGFLTIEKMGIDNNVLKDVKGALHTLKGDSRMLGLESISKAAHKLEDEVIGLMEMKGGKGGEIVTGLFRILDLIENAIQKLPAEIVEIITDLGAPEAEAETTAQTSSKKTDAVLDKKETDSTRKEESAETLTLSLARVEELIKTGSVFPRYASRFGYVLQRLTGLRDAVSARINEDNRKKFDNLLYEFGHELSFYELSARQFEDEFTKLKLVPLATIFDLFPRLIRDVADHTNKKVNFIMRGKDVELEKSVVENLRTILIHILRNSVDHGIELPGKRRDLEKPEEGKVILNAFNRGDNVYIEISDDGAGIDIDRVRTKAVEQGFISRETAGKLDDQEIIKLIFESGFSTKELGDFSGRGVGMDVVASTVKKLNGEVSVRSAKNHGTTILISLPLISSYIPIAIFSLNNVLFGIPSVYIKTAMTLRKDKIKEIRSGRLMADLGDMEVSLIDLPGYFGLSAAAEFSGTKNIFTIKYKDELIAVAVDEIILEKKLLIRKSAGLPGKLKLIIGAVLLGKERAIPVLNISEFFKTLRQQDITFAKDTMRDHLVQDAGNKNILLVEDSPITRAREKQILLGYRLNVFEASNGREALDLLSRQQIDWVITDIEMPVMNGIDLIKHMKGDRSLSRLPIIVVSSYETHMGNVYDLGITFFINKAEFTPQLFVNVLKKEKLIS